MPGLDPRSRGSSFLLGTNDPPLAIPADNIAVVLSNLLLNRMWLEGVDADLVDRALAARPFTRIARVDRTRLRASMEAWVHVNADFTRQLGWGAELGPVISGIRTARGVLAVGRVAVRPRRSIHQVRPKFLNGRA